jgi:tetratricopeptide (TPR) repeat protein
VRRYDSARKQLERAAEYRREAAAETDPKKQAKLADEATDRLERAVRDLERAIRRKPDFYEAHSDLGFALRSLGRYEEALAAYDRALSIESGYSPAIEYRGEAYLELDRLDDAARAYQRLAASDPELAGQLLAKMREWVARRRADPGELDPGVIESFGGWVGRRSSHAAGGGARSVW